MGLTLQGDNLLLEGGRKRERSNKHCLLPLFSLEFIRYVYVFQMVI